MHLYTRTYEKICFTMFASHYAEQARLQVQFNVGKLEIVVLVYI